MGGVDVISVDVLLWALYLLALKNPWEDFRYIGVSSQESSTGVDVAGNMVEGLPYPDDLSKRWNWAGTLLSSIRLNGWLIEIESHDNFQVRHSRSPKITRAAFIKQALLSFVRGYVVLDLTCAYQSHDPYFKDLTVSILSPLPFSGLPPRFFRALIMGAQVWALISQFIYLPCCLLIALNAKSLVSDEWSPHTWQPLFGSPSIILHRGIRGFWGQYWHQSMRLLTSGPGEAVANTLKLKQKGLLRVAIVTTIAFGLSGIIHTGLVPLEPLYANIEANDIRLLVACFFWAQSMIIICEAVVVQLAGIAVGLEVFEASVGMVFKMIINAMVFVAWFTTTLPIFGEAARQLGYWRVWLVPVSFWKGLKGEGWIAWLLR